MKTTLHTYSYDTNNPAHSGPDGEYTRLEIKLRHTPGRGRKMHAIKSNSDFNPEPGEITLEPEFLFENQWNSDKGRVFDWYEEAIFINGSERKNIKRGHYLEITPEMVSIRSETLECRYTGQQLPASQFNGNVPRLNTTQEALGSPYLKESELYLCRLMLVCDTSSPAPLTKAELDYLLPLYIQAQTRTDTKTRDKQRASVIADYEKAAHTETTERDGFIWLLDHGVQIENCIYYSHTGRFCFGWLNPYTDKAREALFSAVADFPFAYDVK